MNRDDSESVSDDDLATAARNGDVRAFEALIERHESRVLRILRLLGVRQGDREDVAQDVFIRVFRHLRGFRRGRSFSAWLYRIAVNASHDHRSRTARIRGGETAWEEGLEDAPDGRPGPGDRMTGRQDWERLENALNLLSERERAVFVLCELEELTSREVARSLGITAITVRRHLSRARRSLQRHLTDDEKKSPPD